MNKTGKALTLEEVGWRQHGIKIPFDSLSEYTDSVKMKFQEKFQNSFPLIIIQIVYTNRYVMKT